MSMPTNQFRYMLSCWTMLLFKGRCDSLINSSKCSSHFTSTDVGKEAFQTTRSHGTAQNERRKHIAGDHLDSEAPEI
jgi:hypothetical protein